MKIRTEEGTIVLSEVYEGIFIETYAGFFGIQQTDSGIRVVFDGEEIFDSSVPIPDGTN